MTVSSPPVHRRTAASGLVLVLGLLLVACGGQEARPGAGRTEEGVAAIDKVVFWDGQWHSLSANNAIAGFILQHGYGVSTEEATVSADAMQVALPKGDIDVVMELWQTNRQDWYDKVTGEGSVVDIGPVFKESTQGWYVPRYVVEGDDAPAPDLRSVRDLEKYANVFGGTLVNCPTSWECADINELKLAAYRLDDAFTAQTPGAAAALDTAIVGAVQKKQPVLAYYWEPTAIMGRFDMVKLEEPEFSPECQQAREQALAANKLDDPPEAAGCAYETVPINKGVHQALADKAPEIVDILEKVTIPTEDVNKIAAFMDENNVDADQAAIWFFENYQDLWREWLPDDVKDKVERALKEAGASL